MRSYYYGTMLSMDNENALTHSERGSKGGASRAAKLSPEQKKAQARLAAESRWGADLPQATHEGPLPIGNAVLAAAVLPSGKRVLSQATFLKALGRSRSPKAGTGVLSTVDALPFFLQADVLKPFIKEELRMSTTPLFFRFKNSLSSELAPRGIRVNCVAPGWVTTEMSAAARAARHIQPHDGCS